MDDRSQVEGKMSHLESQLVTLIAVHRAPGELPQGPHRGGERAQEEVREADGQVLRQPGAVPRPVDQEAGHRLAGGRTSLSSINHIRCLAIGLFKSLELVAYHREVRY